MNTKFWKLIQIEVLELQRVLMKNRLKNLRIRCKLFSIVMFIIQKVIVTTDKREPKKNQRI